MTEILSTIHLTPAESSVDSPTLAESSVDSSTPAESSENSQAEHLLDLTRRTILAILAGKEKVKVSKFPQEVGEEGKEINVKIKTEQRNRQSKNTKKLASKVKSDIKAALQQTQNIDIDEPIIQALKIFILRYENMGWQECLIDWKNGAIQRDIRFLLGLGQIMEQDEINKEYLQSILNKHFMFPDNQAARGYRLDGLEVILSHERVQLRQELSNEVDKKHYPSILEGYLRLLDGKTQTNQTNEKMLLEKSLLTLVEKLKISLYSASNIDIGHKREGKQAFQEFGKMVLEEYRKIRKIRKKK